MSSVKGIGHPSNWLTTKNTKKADVIEGILLGGKETKTLNSMNGHKDHMPEKMINKLTITADNTSDPYTRIKARHVIELLQQLPSTSVVSETQRRTILNSANAIKMEVPSNGKRKKKKS